MKRSARLLALLLALALLCPCIAGCGNGRNPASADESCTGTALRLERLRYAVLTEAPSDRALAAGTRLVAEKPCVLLLSASDGTSAAVTWTGLGDTLEEAFDAAREAFLGETGTAADRYVWLRADVVTRAEHITPGNLAEKLSRSMEYGWRRGLAPDGSFDGAVTEGALNARGILDYEEDRLDAQKWYEATGADTGNGAVLPDRLVAFDTAGWFCGEDARPVALQTEGLYTGVRRTDVTDPARIGEIILTASGYLRCMLRENGQFDYGYYPVTGAVCPGYNNIRHAGAAWNLSVLASATGDLSLKEEAARALDWLFENYLVRDGDAAFVLQTSRTEIQLGGNALAVLAACAYDETFGEDRYGDTAEALGRGILRMWDPETGFVHSLSYPSLAVKEKFLIIYYDGEASFALSKLCAATGDAFWREAACEVMDYFIANDYAQFGDHWISYAVNELTKLEPRPEYYDFGLENLSLHMEDISRYRYTNHTSGEFLAAGLELWRRACAEETPPPGLSRFRGDRLEEILRERMEFMLTGFMWPETAMFFPDPVAVAGSFFVREDAFRIRIDDVQHYLGAYCLYYRDLTA